MPRKQSNYKLPRNLSKKFHNIFKLGEKKYREFYDSDVVKKVQELFPSPDFLFGNEESNNFYFKEVKKELGENKTFSASVLQKIEENADDIENVATLAGNADVSLDIETKENETVLQCSSLNLEVHVKTEKDGFHVWQHHHIVPLYVLKQASFELNDDKIFKELSVSPFNLMTVRRTQHISLHEARYKEYSAYQDKMSASLLANKTDEVIKMVARLGGLAQQEILRAKKERFYNSEFQKEMARRSWENPNMLSIVTANGMKGNRAKKQASAIRHSSKEETIKSRQIMCARSGTIQAKNRVITIHDVIVVYFNGKKLKTYTNIETSRQLINQLMLDFPEFEQEIPSNLHNLSGVFSSLPKKIKQALKNRNVLKMSVEEQERLVEKSRSGLGFVLPPLSEEKQKLSDALRAEEKPKKFEEFSLNSSEGVRIFYDDNFLCDIWDCKDHHQVKAKLRLFILENNLDIPIPQRILRPYRDAAERYQKKKESLVYDGVPYRKKSNNFSFDIVQRS